MPRRQPKLTTHVPQRLLGFGYAGVFASFLLVGLITALAFGVDIRFQLLRICTYVFGGDATIFFTSHLVMHGFWMSDFHFGLVGITYTWVAFHLHPRRVPLWIFAAIITWGAVEPVVIIRLIRFVVNILPNIALPTLVMEWMWLVGVITNGITAGLLVIATRSWAIGAIVLCLAVCNGLVCQFAMWSPAPAGFNGALSHVVLAVSLLAWGIGGRIRYRRETCRCRTCSYDRAGLTPGAPCPECGANAEGHGDGP